MPRPKGTPKTGGRKAGTPNKDNPLKALLAAHSMDYFQPSIAAESLDFLRDKDGQTLPEYQGKVLSLYDIDCLRMKASDRAKLEVDILSYHMPKMQAISAEMSLQATNKTLSDRIHRLAAGEDIPSDNDEE